MMLSIWRTKKLIHKEIKNILRTRNEQYHSVKNINLFVP